MKTLRIKPLVSAIGIAILAASPFAHAQDQTATTAAKQDASSATTDTIATTTKTNDTDVKALVKKINAKISEQQDTINELRAEVKALQSMQQKTSAKASNAEATAAKAVSTSNETTTAIQHKLLEAGASPVITAPYLGVPSRWDASDLIINQPTYNEDVLLMQRDVAMDQALISKGFPQPTNPILEISGKVEAQAWASHPFLFTNKSASDIDVTAAELDFTTHVTNWVNGMMALVYDNLPPAASPDLNQQRFSNSRVTIDHAFITIGDLDKSPFYGTIGQRSLPYGHYSSAMISNTYPLSIFKTKERAILVGYHPMINKLGPYATAFVFKGDTKVGGSQSNVSDYGADLGYLFCHSMITGDFGVSGINNIAESLGMQNTTGVDNPDTFSGFGFAATGANPNAQAEVLQRKVPGVNAHLKLDIGDYSVIAEGNTATSSFNNQDMTFNNRGAKPAAAHVEGIYNFNIGHYPSLIALGYDRSWQALALSMPERRYITTFSTSLFKDTVESLELKREIGYAAGDEASGEGATVTLPARYSNTVTAQVGYYF